MNTTPDNSNISPDLKRMLGYLEQDQANEFLTFDAIDLCLKEGQLDIAEQLLQEASKHWPGSAGVLNRAALIALRRNAPALAIVELEKILEKGLADVAVRYNLAYANYLIGNYERACEVLKPVLAEDDQFPALTHIYTLSLQQLGHTEAAVEYAEACVSKRPNDADLQGILALLYLDSERDIGACRRYTEAALKSNPAHPMALLSASALAMMDEQPETALAYAGKVAKRNPQDGRAWSSMGMAQMFMRDFNAARQSLENAVQYIPNHIGTWHSLAWVQLLQNDITGAETSFNKANEIDHNFGETQGGLAVIAELQGDEAKAKRLMAKAKRLAPAGMTLQYLKLLQLQETGNQAEILKFMQDSLKRIPSFKGDSVYDTVRRMKQPKSHRP